MDGSSKRWNQVTPSQYVWEADALETLRALLPDTAPYYGWSNFEFIEGGTVNECDALVVTPKGVFLIEIKSWAGHIGGNHGTWVQIRPDGSRLSTSNAVTTTDRKAKRLSSLIKRNWRGGPDARRVPFIEPLVWFSNPRAHVELPGELRQLIAIADDSSQTAQLQPISEAILDLTSTRFRRSGDRRVSAAEADELAAALGRVQIKESRRTFTAGSYELKLPPLAERGHTQDFLARHQHQQLDARVRVYSNVVGATQDEARALRDAADREFIAARNPIDGVVRAIDFSVTDFGPAVVFDHHTSWIRLDRFLAERGDELDLDARLELLERLSTTLHDLHSHRLSHRSLTPESVWLRPSRSSSGTARWTPLITDLALAAREPGTVGSTHVSRLGVLPAVGSGAAELVLGDQSMETYLGPEYFTDVHADGIALDVYSLGALAYLLFTDQPPAASRAELRPALAGGGLSASAVFPELDPEIDDLIRRCTDPVVSRRLESMSEFRDAIGQIVARRAGRLELDPTAAEPGTVLADRFEVKQRLGKGSTAVALWCRDRTQDRDVVLKIALGGTSEERLAAEAATLRNLRQQNVVELYDEVRIGDRPALVLSLAGKRSLAGYLRDEGAASTEFLKRWGEDLLEAIRYLEKVGVAHRDVKPDNLGIVELGPRKESHLVLFDFSLASTSADDLGAGTPPYLDPFLTDPGRGRYDLAAERYAAAVTMHEIATGETPTWGDGKSDPAYLPPEQQASLLLEAIDPEVRASVGAFLAKALRRDPAERFDTADDMARAWLSAFDGWEATSTDGADTAESASSDTGTEGGAATSPLPPGLTLDDPISSLTSSGKVRSALRKLGAESVRQVALLDPLTVNKSRGISVRTRKTVLRLRAAILERFAEDLAGAARRGTAHGTDAAPEPAVANGVADQSSPTAPPLPPLTDLDHLVLHLVPPRGKRGPAGQVADTIRALLGLAEPPFTDDWPTLSDVANRFGITPGAVSNALQKGRAHWLQQPELMGVLVDVLGIVTELGGVAGVAELADPLVDRRGSGNPPAEARRLAGAVIRAVLEAATQSKDLAPLVEVRRVGQRTIVAVDGETLLAQLGDRGDLVDDHNAIDQAQARGFAGLDVGDLLGAAVALGRKADELLTTAEHAEQSVVPAADAVPALRAAAGDAGIHLSDARLVRLATAASSQATTNAASDLVPRAIDPVDAVRWSRRSLVTSTRLSIDDVHSRVAGRFPHVDVPGRPELDEVLHRAGLQFEWSDDAGAYLSTATAPGGIGALTLAASRKGTVLSSGGTTLLPAEPQDPRIAAALEIDERLERSRETGAWLVLRAPTDRLVDVQRNLARFQSGQPPMASINLDEVFLSHLRAVAERRRVDWSKLERADDPEGIDWLKLTQLTSEAIEATVAEVLDHDRVIAWFPGVLVRHANPDQMAPLDRIRDAVTNGTSRATTVWLVALGSTADKLPTIDGTAVPVLGSNEWIDLTDEWLRNVHRAGGLTA